MNDYPALTTYYTGRQEPTDLFGVAWFDSIDQRFQLTLDEKRVLEQHHFMVSERLMYFDWASAFISVYSSDLPLFISTDFVLSTLHQSYDEILLTVEWQFLEPNLQALLQSMYSGFPGLVSKYGSDSRFTEILSDVDLYVTVALSLAEGRERLPQYDTPDRYHEVMEAIDAEQMTSLPLFTESRQRKLDFSQFTPRGHYNKEIYTGDGIITLENYFRAMMWLGRIDFLMTAPPENPWEPDWTPDELRRMQQGALLLNELLFTSGKLKNLQKHEEIISFLVGPDDNLSPEELKQLSEGLLTGPEELFEGDACQQFTEALNASDDYGQKIMSNFFYVDPLSSDPGKLPVSYRLLGQKFLLDSYIFSQVVYDRIIFEGKKIHRPLPDPLDAMAALGNEDALALLEGVMEQYHYAPNMAGLISLIDAYDESFWEQSFYNRWLGAIRSLHPPAEVSGRPFFMQTTAWHQEKLNTQLTSWAQLRHDNILYGKQSYTGGTGCSYPYAYIEPYPEFYQILQEYASEASAFYEQMFSGEDLKARERIIEYYERYGAIMENFSHIVQKELDGITLSEQEVTFLKTMINEYMASGPSITGWYTDLYFNVQKGLTWDFTVADVHTQPTDEFGNVVGRVLHVGNGIINLGVFLAENPCDPGHLMAFTGPVSSFHQQVTEQFKRLTDQEWEASFLGGEEPYPQRPDWVFPYLLNSAGQMQSGGRELKGTLYEDTGLESAGEAKPYDYMLLFPNPVTLEANIRFVLKEGNACRLSVYDASGRQVLAVDYGWLPAAEHNLTFQTTDWPPGLYLIRTGIGSTTETKQMVVR
ncbi:MAG: DUF3160 domain-containing protein [Bacteroidales bacterium]